MKRKQKVKQMKNAIASTAIKFAETIFLNLCLFSFRLFEMTAYL